MDASNKSPKSLQQSSEDTVISTLCKEAENISCCFSCGGSVPQVSSVSLLYKQQSGDWSTLQLPADLAPGKNPQEFLQACSTASFGIGGETVTDMSYRDALKLDPECFRADFELENTDILSTIARIMQTKSAAIRISDRFLQQSRKDTDRDVLLHTGGGFSGVRLPHDITALLTSLSHPHKVATVAGLIGLGGGGQPYIV